MDIVILHLCLTVNSRPWLNIIVEERISYTGGSVNRLKKIGSFRGMLGRIGKYSESQVHSQSSTFGLHPIGILAVSGTSVVSLSGGGSSGFVL